MFSIKSLLNKNHKISYSQCGEDIIVDFIFKLLKNNNITYLDIGAHSPTYLNNTYLFYNNNCRGVCVEPDPDLYEELKKVRNKDICLNMGIGASKDSEADFYIMSTKTLNTFSREDAEINIKYNNQKIEKIIKIKLDTINDIIDQNFEKFPNFISLDVEGMEIEILKSLNFSKYRPEIFCIETLTYSENNSEKKIPEIFDLMESNGYFTYADTYINTIFVDKNIWINR